MVSADLRQAPDILVVVNLHTSFRHNYLMVIDSYDQIEPNVVPSI